jgi:hypothetical protein
MVKSFEDIRAEVIKTGGIKCYKMEVLKQASPYKRLGPGVNAEIGEELDKKGLVHTELPMSSWETVYVVDGHSPIGELFRTIQGTPTDEGAKTISAVSKPTEGVSAAEEQLKEVKAVLVQLQDIFSEDADSAAAA